MITEFYHDGCYILQYFMVSKFFWYNELHVHVYAVQINSNQIGRNLVCLYHNAFVDVQCNSFIVLFLVKMSAYNM